MLKRYFKILDRELPAVHWITRTVGTGVSDLSTASFDALFEINREGNLKIEELKSGTADIQYEPAENNLLDLKRELAGRILSDCAFCERRCGVDRNSGQKGYCGVGKLTRYSSEFLHMGEEPELVPSHTIFFSGCTFKCAYCQNWDIAMNPDFGLEADPGLLASILVDGMTQGSRNANFVGGNPDPNLHTILETVKMLGAGGKYLPMVWNSNMYTSIEALELLDGVIDIYLGDFRYGNNDCALELSEVENYRPVVERNFAFAYRASEVMVRHLVLPGHLECCTRPIMEWVSMNMPGVYFNLMFQYRPEYRAGLYPDIDRRLTGEERSSALEMAREYGLNLG